MFPNVNYLTLMSPPESFQQASLYLHQPEQTDMVGFEMHVPIAVQILITALADKSPDATLQGARNPRLTFFMSLSLIVEL
jgi:hypothetical protein